jgi:hypothetical protein
MNNTILSEYYLERYLLGELPNGEAGEIRRQAASDAGLRKTFESILTSNRDILSLYPPAEVKSALLKRMGDRKKPAAKRPLMGPLTWKGLSVLSSAMAAAVLLLIVLLPSHKKSVLTGPETGQEDMSLIKGTASIDMTRTQLIVHRKNNSEVEILSDGNQANEGDLLQLAYVAAQDAYGVILSIDGRGSVTLHFPSQQGESTRLLQNIRAVLPSAIELDDAPDFERFFLITSDSPIDVNVIIKSAETLADRINRISQEELELPAGMNQYSILILKGEGS